MIGQLAGVEERRPAVTRTIHAGGLILAALATLIIAACGGRTDAPPADAAKLIVTTPGIYSFSTADLDGASLGWGSVDPARLRLSNRGMPVPLWIEEDGEGFRLLFYGAAADSAYAPVNSYWLTRAITSSTTVPQATIPPPTIPPPAIPPPNIPSPNIPPPNIPPTVPSAGSADPLDRATAIVRAETDLLYEPERADGDHWLWAALPAPQQATFPVTLAGVAPGPGRLRAALWGSTDAPLSPDHHVRVAVNGHPVADATWDGKGAHLVEADITSGILRDGENEVELDVPGLDGVLVDVPVLDWIEIEHPRFLGATDDRLAIESPGGRLRLAGFSGAPVVVDVTDPARPERVAPAAPAAPVAPVATGEGDGAGDAVTIDAARGRRLIAAGPSGLRSPERILRAAMDPDLRAPDQGADWVAIGPADLLAPLGPLADWRRRQGLQTALVPIEAIYDQFNHGLAEPEAIRAFLGHARAAWQPAPQFVLLVGDATYDPLGHVTPANRNRLPTVLVESVFGGETASDNALVDLDDDGRPDIAVGRVPAQDPEAVQTFVEKVLAYEAALVGSEDWGVAGSSKPAWRRSALAVADGQEASFRADAQTFLDQLAPEFTGTLVAATPGDPGAGDAVRAGIDAGAGVVAYFGHGSVDQWGKDRIFTTEDVAALANGDRLPIIITMTCLTGLFTHPELNSMAEALLWHPEGGAVAVLAPTSLTLASDQSRLRNALAEALTDPQHDTLGAAVLAAWRAVPLDSPGTRDVVATFLLFGDPALRLDAAAPTPKIPTPKIR